MEKELPEGWVESKIEDVTQILDNMRKPISAKERASRQGEIPYYGATGRAGWIDDYIFDEELVLLGEDGAPFFDVKKNVAYLVQGKSWVNNHAHVLKAKIGITTNGFLLHFLNQFNYKGFVGGTTRLKLNQRSLKEIPIPLPPLSEQHRIVAKLDVLFGHLSALQARLARVPDLMAAFRQSVLTQAVTGKLTEEWREGKELEAFSVENKNLNYELEKIPLSWKHVVIGDIGLVKGGKRLPKGDELIAENTGFPYIRARDLKKGTVLTDHLLFLTRETQQKIKRYTVKTGDLYITIVGAKIGDAGVIPIEMNGANLTENAAKITDLKHVKSKYLSIWLRSEISQKNIQETIMSAAQGKLALTRIKLLPVYLPPISEQQEIVRRVESLFARADAIEGRYAALKEQIEVLPQAILAKAFRGELVEQVAAEGDARELLREIEGLRGKGKKGK